jgi:2-dehydro-3-deoxyphosphogluconate aldolase/(4S)-4-hydroxy-2-oxoglutarate aldolase
MPSGGVNLENAGEWIEKGALLISSGSHLTAPATKGDMAETTERAKQYVKAVQDARAKLAKK